MPFITVDDVAYMEELDGSELGKKKRGFFKKFKKFAMVTAGMPFALLAKKKKRRRAAVSEEVPEEESSVDTAPAPTAMVEPPSPTVDVPAPVGPPPTSSEPPPPPPEEVPVGPSRPEQEQEQEQETPRDEDAVEGYYTGDPSPQEEIAVLRNQGSDMRRFLSEIDPFQRPRPARGPSLPLSNPIRGTMSAPLSRARAMVEAKKRRFPGASGVRRGQGVSGLGCENCSGNRGCCGA